MKSFEAGQKVWLYTPAKTKAGIVWSGPWMVQEKVTNVLYSIITTGTWCKKMIASVVSVDRLKAFKENDEQSEPVTAQDITVADTNREEVDHQEEDEGQGQRQEQRGVRYSGPIGVRRQDSSEGWRLSAWMDDLPEEENRPEERKDQDQDRSKVSSELDNKSSTILAGNLRTEGEDKESDESWTRTINPATRWALKKKITRGSSPRKTRSAGLRATPMSSPKRKPPPITFRPDTSSSSKAYWDTGSSGQTSRKDSKTTSSATSSVAGDTVDKTEPQQTDHNVELANETNSAEDEGNAEQRTLPETDNQQREDDEISITESMMTTDQGRPVLKKSFMKKIKLTKEQCENWYKKKKENEKMKKEEEKQLKQLRETRSMAGRLADQLRQSSKKEKRKAETSNSDDTIENRRSYQEWERKNKHEDQQRKGRMIPKFFLEDRRSKNMRRPRSREGREGTETTFERKIPHLDEDGIRAEQRQQEFQKLVQHQMEQRKKEREEKIKRLKARHQRSMERTIQKKVRLEKLQREEKEKQKEEEDTKDTMEEEMIEKEDRRRSVRIKAKQLKQRAEEKAKEKEEKQRMFREMEAEIEKEEDELAEERMELQGYDWGQTEWLDKQSWPEEEVTKASNNTEQGEEEENKKEEIEEEERKEEEQSQEAQIVKGEKRKRGRSPTTTDEEKEKEKKREDRRQSPTRMTERELKDWQAEEAIRKRSQELRKGDQSSEDFSSN